MKKVYKAQFEELENLLNDFESFCEENGISSEISLALVLCFDELFTNIASYGFPNGNIGDVEFSLDILNGEITAILADNGVPFNPIQDAKSPDMTSPIETREIGGLGIFLVKQNVDLMDYKFEDGKNVLTLKKKIL